MKYEITKIDTATKKANGQSKSFATTRKLLSELANRNNGWWEGAGSIIEKNGEQIFHTDDYLHAANRESKNALSIKKILELKKEQQQLDENVDWVAMEEDRENEVKLNDELGFGVPYWGV